MLFPGSDSKDLLSVMYYWNKVWMVHCQVMKTSQMNMYTNEINSDSSEQKYVYLSNGTYYTFRVWKCSGHCGFVLWECNTCPLFGGGLQLCFTIFLVS